jgi:hypothetical protein
LGGLKGKLGGKLRWILKWPPYKRSVRGGRVEQLGEYMRTEYMESGGPSIMISQLCRSSLISLMAVPGVVGGVFFLSSYKAMY